uniref:PknH-like extracellular domain-containing protein n=2 Tax=Kitasatospora sp. CMC57 TaxID=3231513 RepID=A0AB33JZR7_9ACTN
MAALAVLGTSACSVGPAGSAGHPTPSARRSLRAGLLTQDRLPQGFELLSAQVDSTTTGAPHQPASTDSLAQMPCSELGVESFMTVHAPPLEDVAVGLQRNPPDETDDGWFGQESLDRYAPGRSAEVMAAVRAAAQRCASFTSTLAGGTQVQETASVTAAGVAADDGLVLRIVSAYPGEADPFVTETGFVREGDVILMVQQVVAQKPSSGVTTVLAPAVAAYRAAAAG